jgi:hypothetical protein
LDRPFSAAIGMGIITAGHRHGWPVAVGGSAAITHRRSPQRRHQRGRGCGRDCVPGVGLRHARGPQADEHDGVTVSMNGTPFVLLDNAALMFISNAGQQWLTRTSRCPDPTSNNS